MADQYRRPYYETNDNRNRNRRNRNNDGFYWFIMAILLLSGAWPISLIMLLVKLGSDKTIDKTYSRVTRHAYTPQQAPVTDARTPAYRAPRRAKDTVLHQPKKGGKVLTVVGAVVAIMGLLIALEPLSNMISWGVYSYLINDLLNGLGIMLCGGCMYTAGRAMKKRDRRYQHYLSAIKGQSVVMIKTLASIAGVTTRRVYKDLDDMLEDGLLPGGAFVDRARQCLVLDAAAMDYEQEAAAVMQKEARPEPAAPQPAEPSDAPANEYALVLQQIRQVNDDIDDEVMSAKIYHIEAITRSIFTIIEEKPERKQEIRNFFNYYLPTTQKLLNFYAQLEAQPVQSETILDSRKNIEGIMDNLVKGFEAQLDSLFKADALDISTDISVLENMLAQDGLSASTAETALADAARRPGAPAAKAAPKNAASAAATLELPQ